MTSPFTQWARSYLDRGFSPLPIVPGMKHPSYDGHNMTRWSQHCTKPVGLRHLQNWERADNLGLCLATGYGNLIAVDVDDARAYGATREIFGPMKAPAKVGQRGATAFFYDPTGLIKTKIIRAKGDAPGKIGGALVEFLGWGRQTVLPPSIHPRTGRPYRWHNGDLESCRPEDLPIITAYHIAMMVEALKPWAYQPKPFEVSASVAAKIALEEAERRRYERYADKVRAIVLPNLANQSHPGRNQALFNAAASLWWMAHAGIVPLTQLTAELLAACESNGLTQANGLHDATATIKRAFARAATKGIPTLAERARS